MSVRKPVTLIVTGLIAIGGVTVGGLSASAVGGNCRASMETSGSQERVAAWCTSFQANSKARGELVQSGPIINKYTSWFSDASGKKYRSDYGTSGSYATYEVARIK